MLFVLQEKDEIEIYLIKQKIRETKNINKMIVWNIEDFNEDAIYSNKIDMKNIVAIGDIPFVQGYLRKIYKINNMNPIEVPKCLRTEEFLKRKYSIVKAEYIPHKGIYFIKDVSTLKSFCYCTGNDLSYLNIKKIIKSPEKIKAIKKTDTSLYLNSEHLYQVSEFVNVLSEYRVYIIDGQIEAISNYNGNPCILPDTELIKKANIIYSMEKDYPKSYSMDIMITDRGTCIAEIHPWCCLGLYNSLWGDNLLFAYRQGLDYYINYNTKIEEFSN